MIDRLVRLPFAVMIMALGSAAMLVPAIHASALGDHQVARAFFYPALFFGTITLFLAIALAGQPQSRRPAAQLMGLAGLFVGAPVMLAVPFHQAVGNTSMLNAWVEMVSDLTTTGATLYAPERLPPSVHLWRAMVGWMGGLAMWVAAVALLAPLALGGFEIRAGLRAGSPAGSRGGPKTGGAEAPVWREGAIGHRLKVHAVQLVPVYAGLTLALWVALALAGDPPLVAASHAMSVMATSGITPLEGLEQAPSGRLGEALMLVFFVFAVSRLAFGREGRGHRLARLMRDPEPRLAAVLIGLSTALVLVGHVWRVAETQGEAAATGLGALAQAAWGTLFTMTSFLTTTGFQSADWHAASAWSGYGTAAFILICLALVGGGVATTAGGAKLMRVHALFRQASAELARLVEPHAVFGARGAERHVRGQGAFLAWLFIMLMALSLAGFMLAFALTGLGFEPSMVLAIAALTTTGPLVDAAGVPLALTDMSATAKVLFAAAMALGRLEALAIIALVTPSAQGR